MIESTEIAIQFAIGAERWIRQINATAGIRIAVCASIAGMHRTTAGNIVKCYTLPATITVIDRAKVTFKLARCAERGVRLLLTKSRSGIANFTSLAGRDRIGTSHVVQKHAGTVAVAMVDGAKVAVTFAW